MSFKQLQKKWYEKLRLSGFIDCEENDKGSFQRHTLRTMNATVFLNKQDYYLSMTQYANNEPFDDEIEQLVLLRYVEGVTIKDICEELKALEEVHNPGTISSIVRKYESRWNVKHYRQDQLRLRARQK